VGREYLDLIKHEFTALYEEHQEYIKAVCYENDRYGKPIVCAFGPCFVCSPSDLRYVFHSLLILNYMKLSGLNDVHVIEIGGGYGGLSFFLHRLARLCDIRIETYTGFDLPEACLLQEKYLKLLDIPAQTAQLGSIMPWPELSPASFVISNYGLSEFAKAIRDEYIESVLNPFVTHGFMVWNTAYYEFMDRELTTEKERPLTSPQNQFVYISPR